MGRLLRVSKGRRAPLMSMMVLALAVSACAVIPNPGGGAVASPAPIPAPNPAPVPMPTPAPAPQDSAAKPIPATPDAPVAAPAPPTDATNARESGVIRAPAPRLSAQTAANTAAALDAFILSCPGLQKRADISGLTQGGDWAEACAAAPSWPRTDAAGFFALYFTPVQVGQGRAFVTGYYEPEIAGVRVRQSGFDTPVYGKPTDLVEADLGDFHPDFAGRRLRGKMQGAQVVPYDTRAAIDGGSLNGRAPIIAWVADPAEFFFLQVQGSGRLRAPDGAIMRIGFASANGRQYKSIGKIMGERGLLAPGQSTMQGILAWLRANPDAGRAIMAENESYIFFTELTGAGPLGAMGYPVTPKISVAADPKYVPLGAPIWLSLDRAEPNGLWIAQDTGGAIKGANRFDSYWGAGDYARGIAGGMAARGSAVVLIPHAAARRLGL